MDAMEEQFGYDANFVDEVLDFFKCIVCHLVLRQPVQIMTCGHRFCKPCFERVKGYSKHLNTKLCCPIDREPIDVNKVFEDIGFSREIGNFRVKCSFLNHGCVWQGDLRSLQDHEKDCQYKIKMQCEQEPEFGKEDGLIKELFQRLQKCEQSLLEKEKDMAHMKYNVNEMKSMSERKEKEIDSLQHSNIELQNEVKIMKKLNEEMKSHFEKEIIGLKDENKILDTRFKSLEAQVIENKNGLKESEVKELLEKQMKDLKIDSTKKLSDHEESAQLEFEKSLVPIKNELSHLQKDVQKQIKEIRAVQSSTDKALMEERAHVNNIENVLFRYMPYVSKEIKFQWVLTEYNYHFEKGEDVFSPIFFPQLYGYCFKLCVGWTGARKGKLGLYLKPCRGMNVHGDLKRFRVTYELAILRKNGTYETHQVTYADLDKYKDAFTLRSYEQEGKGLGSDEMFTKPQLPDYLINDTLFITCTLK